MSKLKAVAEAIGTFLLVVGGTGAYMYLNALHWAGVL